MNDFFSHVATHLELAAAGLLGGAVLGAGVGRTAFRYPHIARFFLGTVASLRVIPSLAILVIALPLLGVGTPAAILALTLLAAAPIALAVAHGLSNVSPAVIEAAQALGLSAAQIERRVRLPLALPTICGGLRTAAVEVIASATLAAFVGAGGLGEYIITGLADGDTPRMLLGGVSVALLAWACEILGIFGERQLSTLIGI